MKIQRNVLLLGLVSLFTDLASQMVYPLMPKFLTSLGAGLILIGIIEGVAEASTSFVKPLAGKWSDRKNKRLPFIFYGYGLSALMKPLFALATSWGHVFILRFGDRIGKALRNPPRDVLISLSAPKNERGKSFGLHRSFDRIGSIGGPLLAMLVLYFYPNDLAAVFLFAGIPAFLALIFIPFVKESIAKAKHLVQEQKTQKITNKRFKTFLIANAIFTLGNSSNAFLLLKANEVGIDIYHIPLLWALYNAVSALSSWFFGSLSDRVGRLPIILSSFAYYTILYTLFGLTSNPLFLWILFGLYGIYYGLSKGVFKAFIADITVSENRGWYYGIFEMWSGISLLVASILMGVLWETYGSTVAFMTSAGFSALGLITFLIVPRLSWNFLYRKP